MSSSHRVLPCLLQWELCRRQCRPRRTRRSIGAGQLRWRVHAKRSKVDSSCRDRSEQETRSWRSTGDLCRAVGRLSSLRSVQLARYVTATSLRLANDYERKDKDIQVKYVRGGEVSEILLQVQGLFHARHNGAGLEDDLKSTIRSDTRAGYMLLVRHTECASKENG
eukprot:753858-Hanusia_phi.AAC.8